MAEQIDTECNASRRGDVGYCRPPVEHQFKPGQKPPPRKVRANKKPSKSPLDALWKVLHEQRRITINGKAVWMSNLELIVRKGFEFAEKDDNPTISRLVADLMLAGEDPQALETPNQTIFDPNATPGSTTYHVRRRPGGEGA